MSVRSPGAVVIGGYINGLGVVRALAARAVPVAVVTTRPFDIAHLSRHVSGHAAALDVDEEPERLVELLERRASDWRGWALFAPLRATDTSLAELWRRLQGRFRARLRA
jgi:predicted ATP-grasp superfamily ATP-dependent carboligase